VIAPAKTGKDNNNKNAVIYTAQTNKGVRFAVIPGARIFVIVTMKLMHLRLRKHLLSVMSKLHSQQNPQNAQEFPTMGGILFNQNPHQLQLMKKKLTKIMKVVIIKN
jgi:hypothetical protein